ncbi:MAG: sigma-54-dependent Fis family transcriptional regulator, partial [Desulfobacteraceae bacterium]|nr:sigma-54-dependent Fis family transcriptional regulator [Desulfobacteraceae bacterium]
MKEQKKKILVIDDEKNMCHMLQNILQNAGYSVDTSSDSTEGLNKINDFNYDFVLCDLKMPGVDGIGVLENIQSKIKETSFIMMSAYGTIDTAIEAIKLGAFDFISKPFKSNEILIVLEKASEKMELKKENAQLKRQINKIENKYRFKNIVAKSKEMLSIFDLLNKIADYDTTVLITGESGTGKELIAKAVYFNSNRSDKSLVPVNCGGIPENLLESELFGYKKGAFTGAEKDKKGLFEEADKGIIFLDEIGEMPLTLQVKLLRVLQENEIRPLGASNSKKIDVRVIAATSKDLQKEVSRGKFREDLFYRLNVMPIKLPALKNRLEDIPLLCEFFINRYNEKFKKNVQKVSSSGLTKLFNYNWPGNIRELENIIERAMILS